MPVDDPLIETVRRALRPFAGCPVVVATSGGMDSMVLLQVLCTLGQNGHQVIVACHVHHGIRGGEADRDEQFVARQAQKRHARYIVKRVDVLGVSAQTGESQETAARRLRYAALSEAATEVGPSTVIVTAHHEQDQAETVLMRMLRGTGVSGLVGIRPQRELGVHTLIRPLLTITREQIQAYAERADVNYVCDSTNLSSAYTRNRVRHELLPLLREHFNPQVVSHLATLATLARDDDDYLQAQARVALTKIATFVTVPAPSVQVNAAQMGQLPLALQRRVITLVLDYAEPGVTWPFSRVEAVREAALGEADISGARSIGHGWSMLMRSGTLYLRKTTQISGSVDGQWSPIALVALTGTGCQLGWRYRVKVQESRTPSVFPSSKWESYVSRAENPITFRPWRLGDRIEPLGLGGHTRLVSDIFIDGKVPREERAGYPVLVAGKALLWVPGLCRSRHALVQTTDETCWRIEVQRQWGEVR